jgi:hypothetical protein
MSYGLEGVYERLNNGTLETIFAEFENGIAPKPIESGEMDGAKFALYETPDESNDQPEE